MPFGMVCRVGPRNDVLDGVQIPPQNAAKFGEWLRAMQRMGEMRHWPCKNDWTDRAAFRDGEGWAEEIVY